MDQSGQACHGLGLWLLLTPMVHSLICLFSLRRRTGEWRLAECVGGWMGRWELDEWIELIDGI